MRNSILTISLVAILALSGCGTSDTNNASEAITPVVADQFIGNLNERSDKAMQEQRTLLAQSVIGKDAGAQSPRDIDNKVGSNTKATTTAPASKDMYLCDIHFHKSAEHKGGEFTKYAGNGDEEGFGGGYQYSGTLSEAELAKYSIETEHNPLYSGDTIEVHYVYASNPKATLEHGLGSCLVGYTAGTQPLLRVESQVYVLVNDAKAADFTELNKVSNVSGHNQAENIPNTTGTPVVYEGSTTGPGYNETFSPYQVTWSVRPKVEKVNIATVKDWFEHNQFEEEHAHGVRNLVINPQLLSEMK